MEPDEFRHRGRGFGWKVSGDGEGDARENHSPPSAVYDFA